LKRREGWEKPISPRKRTKRNKGEKTLEGFIRSIPEKNSLIKDADIEHSPLIAG
jgi:hypothetical protein